MQKEGKRILFIGPHRPNRNGSQRFRMEQFFPYLRKEGFTCDYSWFLNEHDDRIFYSSGNAFGKLRIFLKAVIIRLQDVLRANKYDIIFIQREALMTGSVFFERQFARSKAKVIFDFDDAIWLEDTSEANKSLKWLKRLAKTADIISMANHVIAGNAYLAEYALRFNKRVTIIPTTVDTTVYADSNTLQRSDDKVCIGWIGSRSTIKHFLPLIPVLKNLKEKYEEQIRIKIVCDKNSFLSETWIESLEWDAEKEVQHLSSFDIGLMPLPDEEWSKGKCGFKAIEYMALKIPPVASPVGMNTEIIAHGENGFLAAHEDEWMKYLSLLVDSAELRQTVGTKARRTVEEKYSMQSQLKKLIALLRNSVNENVISAEK